MVKVTGAGKDFPPHEAGSFGGLCIDVIDMGAKATRFGLKDHVRLVFATTEMQDMPDGSQRRCLIMTTMTKTIGKDSNLRKFLEGWRGKPFTGDELENGFDIDDLLDVPAMLNITHAPSTDGTKTYANINAAARLPRGFQLPTFDDLDYVRVRNRTKQEQDDYFAKFRGGQIAPTPAAGGKGGKAPAPGQPPKGYQPKGDAALEDEDDDLPF